MSPDDALSSWGFFAAAFGFGFALGAWFYFLSFFLVGGGRIVRDFFGRA